jgi:spore coat polysaccharide biosynthesis protein SpsF (cytidylyltransferase family)
MTALEFMVERLRLSKKIDKIFIATTDNPADKELVELCIQNGWHYYIGSENDVMQRVCGLIDDFNFYNDTIIDLTSDCQLICPEMIDSMLDEFHSYGYNFYSNTLTRSFFDGADIQIFDADILLSVNKIVENEQHRTHIGWNIINNLGELQNLFNLGIMVGNKSADDFMPEVRLVLDHPEDLIVIKKIINYFNRIDFTYNDIIDLIKRCPHILDANSSKISKIPGVD